tara:strand:- start:12052 stop:12582 length:531 start_codon:yes stop_codon:yes gene_type:complete
MILILCNDNFYLNQIINLFNQKKFYVTNDKTTKYIFKLNLYLDKNQIKINSPNNPIFLNLPFSFEQLFSEIKNLYMDEFVNLGKLKYRPIKQSLSLNNNLINLNFIHNVIMINLMLNLDIGVDKIFLYGLIWPNDKDIQINKLDTHITNLKNKIKNELKINLKIISNAGFLKLCID